MLKYGDHCPLNGSIPHHVQRPFCGIVMPPNGVVRPAGSAVCLDLGMISQVDSECPVHVAAKHIPLICTTDADYFEGIVLLNIQTKFGHGVQFCGPNICSHALRAAPCSADFFDDPNALPRTLPLMTT